MKRLLLILLLTIIPSCSLSIDETRDIEFIMTGLEVLELNNVSIRVIQYPRVPGNIFLGWKFGQTDKEGKNMYTISIYGRTMGKDHFWEILSHELIHVKQLHEGRVDYFAEDNEVYFVWEGDTVNSKAINYDDRPWENEAFTKSDSIKNIIKDELKRKRIEGNKKKLKRFQRSVTKAIGLD